ncbi:hypothetical protein KUTeg_008201 [Tegillarca granosa]|uniref:Uncharacterized protein n=1 Tax=Tegillarca granosa TaxID=220873 RepID=A0ABQ9F8G1_TEGGR|nr:hypothetical protein KUTeg_008201 [Tegillarca granosa]
MVSKDLDLGLHSLRSGGVTVAANHGVNERCLKRHRRWKCDVSKDGYKSILLIVVYKFVKVKFYK